MKKRRLNGIGMAVTITLLLALTSGYTLATPMKPELAAKKEMVRKQQEQRITPEKRKAAAEALKAERLKIYKAKQAAQKSNSVTFENK